MAQTYIEIQKQIEQLQREAESLRSTEVKGVIDRIREAISHYGLTAQQLGLGGKVARAAKGKAGGRPAAKFGDGQGNVWSGRGPRPHWLRNALAAGSSLEEFKAGGKTNGASLVIESAPSAAGKPAKGAKAAKAPKAEKKVKRASGIAYRDEAGNSWGGRGPRPAWFKAALQAGKSLEDLATR